ncbi:MAG: hypothetical protein E2O68_06015 [Deltaproteobacteria bacterium]|nr:MAG: hypothetical protein E2O68_06015 [Deltaproteobacteria bacterium]
MSILKYLIFFVFSFLILSIPISDTPLFFHLHKPLKPYIAVVFNKVQIESRKKVRAGKEMILESLPEKIRPKDLKAGLD